MSNDSTQAAADRRAVLFHASVVADLVDTLLEARLHGCRLSPREFQVATVLVTRGSLPPTGIAAATGVPAPSISRVIAGLERTGLVVQRTHPSDRRSRLVELTGDGRAAFAEAQAAFTGLFDSIAGALGESLSVADFGVRRLEWALRTISGRPIPTPLASPVEIQSLHYPGQRLSLEAEAEVLEYIEWIRARRRAGPAGASTRATTPPRRRRQQR